MSTLRNVPFALLALLLCAALAMSPVVGSSASKAATHRLTEAQAVDIAVAFCHSVGRPGLTLEKLFLPTLAHQDEIDPHHWHPYWRLKLNNPAFPKDGAQEVDVEVDDLTGNVLNYSTSGTLTGEVVEANAIPKSEAIAQATDALTKAGAFRANEMKLEGADFTPLSKNDVTWYVAWVRMIKGIVYRGQGANVLINAATGEVMAFSVNFHTPPPDSADFHVSKAQATAIAAQQLTAAGLTPPAPPTVKAEVLRPNTFWQPGGSDSDEAAYARLAWTVRYEGHDSASHFCEVWVDAQTGAVIGGEYAGSQNGLTINSKAPSKVVPGKPKSVVVPSPVPKN